MDKASKMEFSNVEIESILSSMELDAREVNTEKGKSLGLRVIPMWINGANPEDPLHIIPVRILPSSHIIVYQTFAC
jgi:Zn-dependent M16 (insulinase) family peptidase